MHGVPRIDIEREFGKVVRACDGLVVSDVLNGSPNFSNADYVFPRQRVVAELKCLTQDNMHSVQSNKRLDDLWERWRNTGMVTENSIHDAYWNRLPKQLQTEAYRILSRPIRKRIQKANRQIRETKSRLNLDDHRGLLLIVNDGTISFSPSATIHAVQLALQSDFRQIREFIFFTVNQFSIMKGVRVPALFWFYMFMDAPQPEVELLATRLGEAWRSHHLKLLGAVGFATELPDEQMEAFWHARYLNK